MKRKMRRGIAALLGAILISNYGVTVEATCVAPDEPSGEVTYEEILENARKKGIETNEISGWPKGPAVNGESAIVMDMNTGAIVYGKGIDEPCYPASITKVLTALVAIENSSLTDPVTITQESVDCLRSGYAHIAMKPGEVITMEDALHALLLASANEVAYAIGETVGGTHENFIKMMNDKARELGCKNSNFVNTNGIFEEDHYTSVRDMALIARAAFAHQELLDVCQTLQYTIPPTNLEEEQRVFQQKHKMLLQGKYHDDRCIAGKTGYTEKAHNTLITVAEEENESYVCVIMKSRRDTFADTKKIIDYAFDNFKMVNISENETAKKLENVSKDAFVTVPNDVEFGDLEWKIDGDNLNYTYNEQQVGTTKANLKDDAKVVTILKQEKKEIFSKDLSIKIVIAFIVIAILGGIIFMLMSARKRRTRLRFRRNRRSRRNTKDTIRSRRQSRRRRRKGRWS